MQHESFTAPDGRELVFLSAEVQPLNLSADDQRFGVVNTLIDVTSPIEARDAA
jgi:hypothetical protein